MSHPCTHKKSMKMSLQHRSREIRSLAKKLLVRVLKKSFGRRIDVDQIFANWADGEVCPFRYQAGSPYLQSRQEYDIENAGWQDEYIN